MPLNDGLTRPRGSDIDDREHQADLEAKRVVLLSGDGSGNAPDINDDGQLHVVASGKLCTDCSTETPLGVDGVYTGDGVDISAYNGIAIFVTSDQEGTLEVQYSKDGATNWRTAETYTVLADSEKWFTPPAFGGNIRLVYTNGSVAQTEFELTTYLRKMPFKWSSHNIEDAITDQDDATLTKAVITGKKANGDYDNVSLTNGGNAKISLEELESGISVNSNSQLKVTQYDSNGNEVSGGQSAPISNEIIGVDYVSGNSGVDRMTETLQVIDYAHHEIHGGSTFRVQHNQDNIPATSSSGCLVIAFFVPDQTKEPHMTWETSHEGNMTATLYEGVTFNASAGTDRAPKNSNRNSANTSVLQGKATGSLVSDYVTVGENSADSIYSGGTAISIKRDYSAKNDAGGQSRRNEVVLKTNTNYAFCLANNETTTQGGQIRLEWYEHTPKN